MGIATGVLAAASIVPEARADRIYVSTSGNDANDGDSWQNALRTVKKALEMAQTEGDEIWVAAGTYVTDVPGDGGSPTGVRTDTFEVTASIVIRGHFAGTEDLYGERDHGNDAWQTILTGEIGGGGIGDNAHHVVVIESAGFAPISPQLDGLVIEGGNADGQSPFMYADTAHGGGELEVAGSVFYRNCAHGEHGEPEVNNGGVGRGGAIYAGRAPDETRIMHCTFAHNAATSGPDAIQDAEGGALFMHVRVSHDPEEPGPSGPFIGNCIFWGNVADVAGAEAQMVVRPLTDNGAPSTYPDGVLVVAYSIIEDWPSSSPPFPGQEILDADPRFVDPAEPCTGQMPSSPPDYRLQGDSPARDTGGHAMSDAVRDRFDIDGDDESTDQMLPDRTLGTRIQLCAPDMGAYEIVAIGDLDGNGAVGFNDVLFLLSCWQEVPSTRRIPVPRQT
ncbi:MAG: hypothetical protein KF817_04920 [Phycisphaeraceae bacterium]|nr:hypothetical protein [Phycisphaeraceae bacterium]